MSKIVLSTQNAPAAIGPYSQGIAIANLAFTSGQLPIDPVTGVMPEGIEAQAAQSLKNVAGVLETAGSSMEKAVKVTVFLTDMNDFAVVNEVYKTFFHTDCPARSAVQVARLPKDASIEVEAIAYI